MGPRSSCPGDIGALAGKPVMEGKAILFKRFANVDVFDIEINTHDPDEVIKVCQLLEPTFGAINLEDIKAPECFYIEETLKKTMKIPVFTMTSMVPQSSPGLRCLTAWKS
jgi:malate dehydrogenase (oxaloacetate-decarboxylating)(NADP+)